MEGVVSTPAFRSDCTSLLMLRIYVPSLNCYVSAISLSPPPVSTRADRFLVLTVVAPPLNHLDGEVEQRRRYRNLSSERDVHGLRPGVRCSPDDGLYAANTAHKSREVTAGGG